MTPAGDHQVHRHVHAGIGYGFYGPWCGNARLIMERGTGAAVVWRRVILGCAALIGAIDSGEERGGIDHVGSVHDATFLMGSVKELRTEKKEQVFYARRVKCLCF